MKPFFSVIIPTLNEERYIPVLLKCLSIQKEISFEVIIVDARSTDGTLSQAKKFSSHVPSLKTITSSKANVSYQRNTGAKKAKGEYLVFFDADVQIGSDFLQLLKKQIDHYHYELMTTYLTAPDDDMLKQFFMFTANMGKHIVSTMGKPVAGGYNIIVKKSVFHTLEGFNESVYYAEDVDFVWRAKQKTILLKVLSTPQQMYSFRRFEKYGYWQTLGQYLSTSIQVLKDGPMKKPLEDYPMGGQDLK